MTHPNPTVFFKQLPMQRYKTGTPACLILAHIYHME